MPRFPMRERHEHTCAPAMARAATTRTSVRCRVPSHDIANEHEHAPEREAGAARSLVHIRSPAILRPMEDLWGRYGFRGLAFVLLALFALLRIMQLLSQHKQLKREGLR